MEAAEDGGAAQKPKPPGVDALRDVSQEPSSNPPATETMESCLPDTTPAAEPLRSAEETAGSPASGGRSPGSSRVPDVRSGAPQRSEPKPDVWDFEAVESFARRQPLWGEQMTGVPGPRSCPRGKSEAYKTTQFGKGCSFLLRCMSDSVLPDSRAAAADLVKGATDLPRRDSKKPAPVPCEVDTCNGGEVPSTTPSQGDGGKPEPLAASQAGPAAEEADGALFAMLSAVAGSRLAVRSQQKDEPDFTPAQKLAILRELYHAKPLVFLERFRTALGEEHLACFRHLAGNYEAEFYCAEVRRAGKGKTRHTRVRNKRYAALQQLIRDGEYFSDEQMRSRDPLLYEQYIGQYLSAEELQALGGGGQDEAPCSLSGVLLDSYQEAVLQRRLRIQQEQEEAAEEEEEEEEEEGDEEDEGHSASENGEDEAPDCEMGEWAPDPDEKAFLREEFTSRMYQRFLEGKDRDFDYSEVDENPDFDNLDIVSRDEEERYFDGEEAVEANAMEAE